MIQDLWRKQNAFGEVNNKPSLTEPVKTYSVYDYLRDPSIVLGSRKPVEGSSSAYIDTTDPRNPKLVEIQSFDDLPDAWDTELPRDPALYGAGDRSSTTKRKATGTVGKSPQPEAPASKTAAQAAGKQAAGAESANQAKSDEEV